MSVPDVFRITCRNPPIKSGMIAFLTIVPIVTLAILNQSPDL